MKSSIALSCLLLAGACARDEYSRSPAASVETEPQHAGAENPPAERVSDARVEEQNEATARTRADHDNTSAPRERVRADHVANDTHAGHDDGHHEVADKDRDHGPTAVAKAEQQAADNTGVNQRDVDRNTVTPLDQRENASDLEITQKIRQMVVGDDALSFTAKNVKIITQEGRVTLRGPVKSAAERTAIAAHANKVAGAGRVDNQLETTK
jgi:osmotically-inducible protein OsmY